MPRERTNPSGDGMSRIGLAVRPTSMERMRALCEKFDLSQGGLVEALVMGMTDDEVQDVIARVDGTVIQTKAFRRERRKQLMDKIAKMTPEQIDKLLK